ncbi:hypothetical protein [Mangrovivirga cuniculi]|nr:hypothetical protein [Mangrovivirga cuniculi]
MRHFKTIILKISVMSFFIFGIPSCDECKGDEGGTLQVSINDF